MEIDDKVKEDEVKMEGEFLEAFESAAVGDANGEIANDDRDDVATQKKEEPKKEDDTAGTAGTSGEEDFDEARRNMALAAELHAPMLRVYGGRVPDGYTVETILPALVDNLRKIGDEAEAYDVTLALETHDDWTDSAVFARLMREVDHPRVRVLWDLHHPYRTNGEPASMTYQNIGPYTVSIHVKDSIPVTHGEGAHAHQYVLLGEGDVPLKEMLDLLVAGGYEGYAILEWEKRWIPDLAEPEIAFPQYVEKMREWLS